MTTLLEIGNVDKVFPDGTVALRNASLKVNPGEFIVILGPSGAGKTTLMRSINGLVDATSGTIRLNGMTVEPGSVREIRQQVGMIFQNFNLVKNLSVINNVLTGALDKRGSLSTLFYMFSREDRLRALECLDQVGILAKAYLRADKLSGGQQQRVGIARALIRRPKLLLADEPVASLDPMIAFNILSLLKEVSASHGIAVLCNLHQVDFALRFADRLVGLSGGRIVMDEPVSAVDEDFVRRIYQDHDQGMFFGPGATSPTGDDGLRFVR